MTVFINTSNGPVDISTIAGLPPVTPLPPVGNSYGECGECGAELEALKNDDGTIRTTYCEYCNC
ncbi:hypothetical protein GCM10010250_21990 [Streptomyces althioticus]|uniref:hypothetical protein n=1 Tax=Streptomyces althioticus TaxID=83380 RepID=UPI001873C4C3|nr:hypothetical protein GCM10010250_21990 [Streptomyces althioticus]